MGGLSAYTYNLNRIDQGYQQLIRQSSKTDVEEKFESYVEINRRYSCYFQHKTKEFMAASIGCDFKEMISQKMKQRGFESSLYLDNEKLEKYIENLEIAFLNEIENHNRDVRKLYELKDPTPIYFESLWTSSSNPK